MRERTELRIFQVPRDRLQGLWRAWNVARILRAKRFDAFSHNSYVVTVVEMPRVVSHLLGNN